MHHTYIQLYICKTSERERERERGRAQSTLMAESEREDAAIKGCGEEEKLMEGVAVLDFEMLCSTVAMQTQGKWSKFQDVDFVEYGGGPAEFGGVLRMWEGDLLDCLHDRRIALESVCCPCYRFGKNMRRAGFGPCFLQGATYLILVIAALFNIVAFVITKRRCFLYLGVASSITVGMYLGFFRSQIRKKFNIMGSDSFLDDCVSHLIFPCCTLSQESRTLEMNNVQDGTWHGRGDTKCIGSYGEGTRAFFELSAPPTISIKGHESFNQTKGADVDEHSWTCEALHSVPFIPPSQ